MGVSGEGSQKNCRYIVLRHVDTIAPPLTINALQPCTMHVYVLTWHLKTDKKTQKNPTTEIT